MIALLSVYDLVTHRW